MIKKDESALIKIDLSLKFWFKYVLLVFLLFGLWAICFYNGLLNLWSFWQNINLVPNTFTLPSWLFYLPMFALLTTLLGDMIMMTTQVAVEDKNLVRYRWPYQTPEIIISLAQLAKAEITYFFNSDEQPYPFFVKELKTFKVNVYSLLSKQVFEFSLPYGTKVKQAKAFVSLINEMSTKIQKKKV